MATIELWRGNAAGALKIVAEHGLLDAGWMALAPMAGHDVWKQMQSAYAEQLEAEGQVHPAGSCAAFLAGTICA